jgi:hypothetical protein
MGHETRRIAIVDAKGRAIFAALCAAARLRPVVELYTLDEMLRQAYRTRKATNARFSQRAFAMQLRLDSGSLSQVLGGSRSLSPRATLAVLRRLGRAEDESRAVAGDAERAAHERRLLRQIRRPDFIPSSRVLARRLRLSPDDVNAALTRLLRKGTLRMTSPATWTLNEE